MKRFFRHWIRTTAQGTHCLSVGTLALGLGFGSLVPPAAVPPATDPQPAPPALAAQAPQEPQPTQTPQAPLQDTAPAPAVPTPPQAPPKPAPSPLHLLDTHDIPPGPFGALIYEVAARYSLNPHLVAAVVRVESSFNPRALSRKGACGLMQLLPETARRFGLRRKDLFDPAKNLDAGARYLKWLADRFGQDPALVLAAYNAGEGAVQRYGGVPPYKETRGYVDRIFSMLGLSDETAPPPAVPAPGKDEAALAR